MQQAKSNDSLPTFPVSLCHAASGCSAGRRGLFSHHSHLFRLQVLDDHLVQVPAGVAADARVVVPDSNVVEVAERAGRGHQEVNHRAASQLLSVARVSAGQLPDRCCRAYQTG